jgi:hypothetical protein
MDDAENGNTFSEGAMNQTDPSSTNCHRRTVARALAAEHMSRGECTRCGKRPPEDGDVMCLICRQAKRLAQQKYSTRHRAALTALGICTQCCDRVAIPNTTYCTFCAEHQTEQKFASRRKNIALGLTTRGNPRKRALSHRLAAEITAA